MNTKAVNKNRLKVGTEKFNNAYIIRKYRSPIKSKWQSCAQFLGTVVLCQYTIIILRAFRTSFISRLSHKFKTGSLLHSECNKELAFPLSAGLMLGRIVSENYQLGVFRVATHWVVMTQFGTVLVGPTRATVVPEAGYVSTEVRALLDTAQRA
ncbi:hypothetical protein HUJ04_009004 [Dendroctonus ponderosae]|nr:hypothetical protein HUJ04_009004 [Dendroctonus ponderosae]